MAGLRDSPWLNVEPSSQTLLHVLQASPVLASAQGELELNRVTGQHELLCH